MAVIDFALPNDILAHHGRNLIQTYTSPLEDKDIFPVIPKAHDTVGILGAGVGGLYTALMLQSLNVSYEVLEATDRVGGRLFTYQFPGGGPYDYYDVGAMRYPLPKLDEHGDYKPGVMWRVGHLFKYIGLQPKLINYYFSSAKRGGFRYFNGIRERIGEGNSDFDAPKLGINEALIKIGPSTIVHDVINPFAEKLFNDLKNHTTTGWEEMMQSDVYSTRAYMSLKYTPNPSWGLPPDHLSNRVVNWLETFDKSTGWYDRGLTETVLEAIAFGQVGDAEIDWKCIDGGSHVLPETIEAFIKKASGKAVVKNTPVTAIGLENPKDSNSSLVVTTEGGQQRKYAHVIATLPFPVLRTLDLTKANLDVLQQNALRGLDYGPSIKVGMRFNETWWTIGQDKSGEKFDIVGGQSYTDLPIRTVVYPSYGVNSSTPSKTLIASYCWTTDAERLGSLIKTGEKKYEDQLKHLMLSNMAAVHNVDYDYLASRFVAMHSWDWSHNPLTMGAFAFYGPGDFEDMYTSLNRPAGNNRLHFAGEALSVRHAWVVGALDSAWRAVYSYLSLTDPGKIDSFFGMWGKNPEWFETVESGETGDRANSLLEKLLRRSAGGVAV
ncbi:hypothetical protein B0H34DRAFT_661915 [Crassisporium funariophilum]|nr:hypothetical protein B0H34DRAFT_661915 [Crassisporium funariophilum]